MKDSILVVDLDGTLIYSDLLHEAIVKIISFNPFLVFKLFKLMFKGKAAFKEYVFSCVDIPAESLPYNGKVLNYINQRKSEGSHIVLCTASNIRVAMSIADYLQVFDEVIASDSDLNVSGKNKSDLLVARYGAGNFDYIGNANVDLHVWLHVRNAYVARPVIGLLRKAEHKKINLKVIDRGSGFSLRPVIKLLRPHQWLKNVLLVVPALTAVEYVFDQNILLILVLAFISFGLCASSVYVLNDLIDIDNDRAHNRKKFRPIAAGFISVPLAVSLFVSLLLSAFVLAQFLSPKFFAILLLYFIITLAYSLGIKKIALVDCFVLSSLYTIRIISGAVVLDLDLTFWLVLFSFMLFLSLSFLKRVSELYAVKGMVGVEIKGRGYKSEDYGLVQTFGVSAGVTSVFLFGLYLNTPRVIGAYAKHEISILAVPVLLFWVFWVWFSAQRGRMHDDPVIFAIKDLVSIISGICFILVLAVARF